MDMYSFHNGEFVAGKGEHIYQKVLNDFSNTDFIGIITFNISTYGTQSLLNRLKVACKKGTEAVIITNIPKRWDSYKYEHNILEARKAIKSYVDILNPEKFGYKLSAYFDFNTHAKIIVTDHFVYCGSANFSDASKNNYECGFISDDENIIQHIKEDIFPSTKSTAIPYYQYDFATAMVFLCEATTYCEKAKEIVFDATYEPWEDYETNFKTIWIYKTNNSGISTKMLSEILDGFQQYENALQIILEIINSYYEKFEDLPSDVQKLENIYEEYQEKFKLMLMQLETLFNDIEDLAHYDYQDNVNTLLNSEYGLESFDENLEHYIELAMDDATFEFQKLIESAEPTIKKIISYFDEIIFYYDEMQCLLKSLLKVNNTIDNT